MSKITEEQYFKNLRGYTDGKTYTNLVGLLNSRYDTLKEKLVSAEGNEYKTIQGQAREVKHLLKGLTREQIKSQFDGAFN